MFGIEIGNVVRNTLDGTSGTVVATRTDPKRGELVAYRLWSSFRVLEAPVGKVAPVDFCENPLKDCKGAPGAPNQSGRWLCRVCRV